MSKEEDYFDFTNEVDQASWELIEPHYKSGALFVVDPKLDLVTVANVMAKDQVSIIKIWLDNKELRRLTKDEVRKIEALPESEKFCDFIIVQPYVLILLKES
jgi:hypothetical protein